MNGRQRTVMTGIHCLKHIQSFPGTALPDNNPVRPHTQRVDQQVSDRNLPPALNICRTGFKPYNVPVTQFKFSRILNRYKSFFQRNKLAENVQQGGFTGTGPPGNNNILSGFYGFCHKISNIRCHTSEIDQIFCCQFFRSKFSYCDRCTIQCQRRNNGIYTGTIRQTGINHGTGFVNMASQRFHNSLND